MTSAMRLACKTLCTMLMKIAAVHVLELFVIQIMMVLVMLMVMHLKLA